MEETKTLIHSKGVVGNSAGIGLLAILFVGLLKKYGIEDISQEELTQLLVTFFGLVANIVGLIGRITAKKQIKVRK
jgi:hypothetical protein